MNNITVGDWVVHNHYSWHGKMKVLSIVYGTAELLTNLGTTMNYHIANLSETDEPEDLTPYYRDSLGVTYSNDIEKKEDPLYCTCSRSKAQIVESSTQIQGSVNEKDKFKFCRTCKKEYK